MLCALQQCSPFPPEVAHAEHTTVGKQVLDFVQRAQACELEALTHECPNLTWNQVFLAVDGLSRRGELRLVSQGRGLYTVILRQPLDGRPYPPYSHQNLKEVSHV